MSTRLSTMMVHRRLWVRHGAHSELMDVRVPAACHSSKLASLKAQNSPLQIVQMVGVQVA